MKYNYQEVINIIQNTRRFGKWTGYEVSGHMLERLGNPQKGIPFVHVAGTNGKGSTTAFLCSILQQAGKKVGMFTSPHLVTFRERIRINGAYISEEDVTRLGNLLLETAFDMPPTMFDYCLAMAVLYFKEQDCDIMVMETGIGGRYDSTNALGTPEVAVITKIGLDHTAILGDTLEVIAGEKAGIIKKGCPVVTTFQQEEVRRVLFEKFLQENPDELPKYSQKDTYFHKDKYFASTKVADNSEDFQNDKRCDYSEKNRIHIQPQWEKNPGDLEIADGAAFYEVSQEDLRIAGSIPMKMQGSYQVENAATAMLAAKVIFYKWQRTGQLAAEEYKDIQTLPKTLENHEAIQKTFEESKNMQTTLQVVENRFVELTTYRSGSFLDFQDESMQEKLSNSLSEEKNIETYIRQGIASAVWKGRMEIVNDNPFFMIDGAHNAHGVHALAESLKALYPNEKFRFIMAVMADKDYEEMIEELLPLAVGFITVTPESSRALQSKDLAECIRKKGLKAFYAEDMEAVIRPLLPRRMQGTGEFLPIKKVKCDSAERLENDIRQENPDINCIQETAHDNIRETAHGNIQEIAHNNMQEMAHDNIQETEHGNIQEIAHDNIQETDYDNIQEIAHDNIQEMDKNTTYIKKTDGETHIYLTVSAHKTIAFGSLYFIGAIEAMLEGCMETKEG